MNISTINSQEVYYFDIPDSPSVEMLRRNLLYGQVFYNLIDPHLDSKSTILDIGSDFGTFSLVPANKGHRVLMVESRDIMVKCLRKTFDTNQNVSILENIPTETTESIDCINFARKNSLLSDIQECYNLLIKEQPVLLIHINIQELQYQSSNVSDVFSRLQEIGYHSFLYNAPNFYLYVDQSAPFPFCEMVVIALNHKTIINKLGHITFGSYLQDDIINDLINTNQHNAQPECLEYLQSLKTHNRNQHEQT